MLNLPTRPSAAASPTAGIPKVVRPPAPPPGLRPPSRATGEAAVASMALALLTIASASGLVRVFDGHSWIGPVVLTALVVHGTCLAARRWRLPLWTSVPIGVLGLVLIASWFVLGYTTHYGIPTGRTFSDAFTGLSRVNTDVATTVVPVRVTIGFVLAAMGGTAAVALLGDWAAFSRRSALYGAAPAFGFFVFCCLLGEGAGRQWAISVEVAALLLYLLAHTASVTRGGQSWFGNRRRGSVRWGLASGSLIAGVSLITALALAPAVKGADGSGAVSWRSGLGGANGAREVPNPIVDLETRILTNPNTPVFTVQSPVPSYWRLTALNTFTGQDWVSTYIYRGFKNRLPDTGTAPPGSREISEAFNIENLDSVWLPAAFTPVAVTGASGVSYDPASNSLITFHSTNSNGLQYSVESYQYLSSLNPTELEAAPPLKNTSSLSQYLSLPPSVPASVYALAHSIITTAGATTEYDKALALQNYLLGPKYTYSLDPPDNGYGIDSLTNFLFYTRTGYCQQFAGAYAVLARAIGLPTRLAFGFATGKPEGGNTYQVTDADAHTWPEVYFGSTYGWLPFEPTKGFSDPVASNYAGTGSPGSTDQGGAADSAPYPHPLGGNAGGPAKSSHVSTPTSVAGPSQTTPAVTAPGSGANGWWILLLVVVAIAVWVCVNNVVRRLRWAFRRHRARGDPASRVLAEWALVRDLLAWWGVRAGDDETPNELSKRAATSLIPHLRERSPWLPGGLARLARLASEASFAPTVPSTRAAEALEVGREVHQRMVRSADGRLLVLWALLPFPGRRSRRGAEAEA